MTPKSNLIFLLILGMLAVAFFAMGIMLRHHWRIYSPNQILGRLFQILYWAIGGTLLAIMTITYFISFV
ncbi:MAG: hypothetical protein AAB972_03505 [Patescibacteria group bacterium]